MSTKFDLQLEGLKPEEVADDLSDALQNRLFELLQDYGYDELEGLPTKFDELTTADMRQILRDNEVLENALALDKVISFCPSFISQTILE